MIPCTGDCVYQTEGQCSLVHAASKGSSAKGDCRYRVSRSAVSKRPQILPPSRPESF